MERGEVRAALADFRLLAGRNVLFLEPLSMLLEQRETSRGFGSTNGYAGQSSCPARMVHSDHKVYMLPPSHNFFVSLCQRRCPGGGAGNICQLQRKQEGNRSGQCWQIPTMSEVHLKPAKC